jgi:hypothetical protein
MHSKIRIVVNLLVAFATVIHFTFGCCLHISHAGAGHTCGLGSSHAAEVQHAAEAQEDCDCHGHDGDDEGEHRHGHRMKADDGTGIAPGPECDGHDCGGCDCVANATAADQSTDWWPLDSNLDAVLDARDLEAACASARPTGGGDPPPMPQRHSLYERMLV